MLMWLTIACTVLVSAGLGFAGGWYFRTKRFYRAALRKDDGNGTLQMAFQPAQDGAMELIVPNSSLKALKRGDHIECRLQGNKNSMVFRLRMP